MAYFAPYIDASGLHLPLQTDIETSLLSTYSNIFGSTAYLQPDAAEYQMISAFAVKANDVFQAVQLDYNNRSPITAVGAAMDSLFKLNGLARLGATQSTCAVVVTGTPGAVIKNGQVTDQAGNTWSLPSSITIGAGGTATVTATCAIPGPISAQPNTITTMFNPTAGWLSVTNTVAATLGQYAETDSAFRARQSLSVALPGMTMLASTVAAIAATGGVTRYNVLENPTGAVDQYGNPPHSITAVVEGGADADVAQAIYSKRGVGCFTNGTTTVAIMDPVNDTTMPIAFDRPTYVPIYVAMLVHGLSGFTSTTTTSIQTAVVNFLQGLQIGESVIYSSVNFSAAAVMPNPLQPQFSIKTSQIGAQAASTTASTTNTSNSVTVTSSTGIAVGQVVVGVGIPTGTTVSAVSGTTVTLSAEATATASGVALSFFTLGMTDITLLFNQVAQGSAANVVITTV